MNAASLHGKLINIDGYLSSEKFGLCIGALTQINENLNPTFFTPSCDNFNAEILSKQLFPRIINLSIQQNDHLARISKKFLKHWLFIYASISPSYFLKTFSEIMQQAKDKEMLNFIVPTIKIALSNLGKDEIKTDIQLILNIVNFMVMFADFDSIPAQLWEIISNFCDDSEIIRNLPKCQKSAKATAILIKRNPNAFIGSLSQTAPLKFLSELFTFIKPGLELDYTAIFGRISQSIIDPINESSTFNDGCALLAVIINYVDLPIKEEFLNNITQIIESISFLCNSKLDQIHTESTHGILTFFISAAKKNLYPKESLKQINTKIFPKIQTSASRSAFLCSVIFCAENEDDLDSLNQLSSSIKPWLYTEDFMTDVDTINKNLPILMKFGKRFLTHFVWICLHPVIPEIKPALAILKLLNKVDNEILYDKQINTKLDRLIYTYIQLNDGQLNAQIIKFIKKCHIKIDVSEIDFSNENSAILFPFIDNMLFREMAGAHIYPPNSLHLMLSLMMKTPKQYSSFLSHAFGALEIFALEFGINLTMAYAENNLSIFIPDQTIITIEEMHELFNSVKDSLFDSPFGQLLKVCVNIMITNFQVQPNQSNIQNEILNVGRIVVVASKIITLCPSLLFDLLAKCRMFYNNTGRDENLRLIFRKAFDDIQRSQLSTKFASHYVRYLFGIKSPEQIFTEHSKYGFAAAASDRFVATHLKFLIDQDYFAQSKNIVDTDNLEPFPSFLSFIDSTKQEKWINICANTIDPNDWLLSKTDDPEIIFSKITLDEKSKQKVIETVKDRLHRLKEERQVPPPEVYDYSSRAETYTFTPPKVVETTVKVHETEPATLFNLTSFLYHSTMPLPKDVTMQSIEEIALKNLRSPRLLSGFFIYAFRKKYQINIEEWSKKLYIKTFNDSWFLVVALFLLNVKGKFSELKYLFQNVVRKCFAAMGYSKLTRSTFVKAYQKEIGIRWYLVRNAILVDIDDFKDYPLIISELKMNKKIFMDFFKNITDMSQRTMFQVVFSTMCNMFVKPEDSDMTVTTLLPTNFLFPSRMISFKEGVFVFRRNKVLDDLIDLIIAGLKRQSFVPLNFFYFLTSMFLNDKQYQEIEELFFTKVDSVTKNKVVLTSFRNIIAPAYFLISHEGEDLIDFCSLKPPSFARAFFRSTHFNLARYLNQTIVKEALPYLSDVFPDLCYNGYTKHGMKMSPTEVPFSKLYFNALDEESGKILVRDLNNISKETISCFKGLCSLEISRLVYVLPSIKSNLKEELGRIVLGAAASEYSNFAFAAQATREAIKNIGNTSVLAIVGNREFIDKSTFEFVVIILIILEKSLKSDNANEYLFFFNDVLRNENKSLFANLYKTRAFTNFKQEKYLDAIVHMKALHESENQPPEPEEKQEPSQNEQKINIPPPIQAAQSTVNQQPSQDHQTINIPPPTITQQHSQVAKRTPHFVPPGSNPQFYKNTSSGSNPQLYQTAPIPSAQRSTQFSSLKTSQHSSNQGPSQFNPQEIDPQLYQTSPLPSSQNPSQFSGLPIHPQTVQQFQLRSSQSPSLTPPQSADFQPIQPNQQANQQTNTLQRRKSQPPVQFIPPGANPQMYQTVQPRPRAQPSQFTPQETNPSTTTSTQAQVALQFSDPSSSQSEEVSESSSSSGPTFNFPPPIQVQEQTSNQQPSQDHQTIDIPPPTITQQHSQVAKRTPHFVPPGSNPQFYKNTSSGSNPQLYQTAPLPSAQRVPQFSSLKTSQQTQHSSNQGPSQFNPQEIDPQLYQTSPLPSNQNPSQFSTLQTNPQTAQQFQLRASQSPSLTPPQSTDRQPIQPRQQVNQQPHTLQRRKSQPPVQFIPPGANPQMYQTVQARPRAQPSQFSPQETNPSTATSTQVQQQQAQTINYPPPFHDPELTSNQQPSQPAPNQQPLQLAPQGPNQQAAQLRASQNPSQFSTMQINSQKVQQFNLRASQSPSQFSAMPMNPQPVQQAQLRASQNPSQFNPQGANPQYYQANQHPSNQNPSQFSTMQMNPQPVQQAQLRASQNPSQFNPQYYQANQHPSSQNPSQFSTMQMNPQTAQQFQLRASQSPSLTPPQSTDRQPIQPRQQVNQQPHTLQRRKSQPPVQFIPPGANPQMYQTVQARPRAQPSQFTPQETNPSTTTSTQVQQQQQQAQTINYPPPFHDSELTSNQQPSQPAPNQQAAQFAQLRSSQSSSQFSTLPINQQLRASQSSSQFYPQETNPQLYQTNPQFARSMKSQYPTAQFVPPGSNPQFYKTSSGSNPQLNQAAQQQTQNGQPAQNT